MILVFNENYTLKYCVSSNTPQKLLDGEFEAVINDLDSIYAIENGATVTWNSTISEVEIDYSTVEVITDESYTESLESEIAELRKIIDVLLGGEDNE